MHCSNCGDLIAPNKRYCAGCGEPVVDPEATRVAGSNAQAALQPSADGKALERVVFSIRPTMLFVIAGYIGAVAGAFLIVGLLGLLGSFFPAIGVPISLGIALVLGLSLLLVPAYYHIRRNMIRYTLTDSKIQVDEGFIRLKTRSIPLRRIQDVTVEMSIFQRLLGFGTVVIDNASELDGKIMLKNISKPRHFADLMLHEMRDD